MLGGKTWLTVGFQFIPQLFDEVEVGALCRPVKFCHTKLMKPFLVTSRKESSPNYCHNNTGSIQLSKISLYVLSVGLPLIETKETIGTVCPHTGYIVYSNNFTF